MALQRVGNLKYIGWYVTVPCCLPKIISELEVLYNSMQMELENWKNEVNDARSRHYELNYFTTPQLLTLRRALGGMESSSKSLDSQVLALLQSISPEVSEASVKEAFRRSKEVGDVKQKKKEIPLILHQSHDEVAKKVSKSNKKASAVPENLTPDQREILKNLSIYDCEKLVLKAFKEGLNEEDEIENRIVEMMADGVDIDKYGSDDENESSGGEDNEEMDDASTKATEENRQFVEPSISTSKPSSYILYMYMHTYLL